MAKRYLGGGVSFEQKDVYQEFSKDPGGGSSTLSGLTDVDISNPTDGQTLVYNAATGKWENGAGGGGSVAVVGYSLDLDTGRSTCDKTAAEIHTLFGEHGSVVLSKRGLYFRAVVAFDYDDSDPEDFYFNMLIVGSNANIAAFTAAAPSDYPYTTQSI